MPIPRLRSVEPAGDAVRQVIRAYHGSPYDFDRFDASKIGTGEGAQAYGHGLYFSGAEGVGKFYRDHLAGPPDVFIGGEPVPPGGAMPAKSARERATYLLRRAAARHPEDPISALREAVLDASDQFGGRDVQPIIDSLMRFKSDGVSFGPRKGKMYEVEIGLPEDNLIDYDAPISSQPASVRERLARMEYTSPGIMRMAKEDGTGRAVVDAIRQSFPSSPAAGSKILADAGIPGVRYLDEYSRGAPEGTRNYVIFPGAEDQIRILRKYAVPGAVGVGAASMGGDGDQ